MELIKKLIRWFRPRYIDLGRINFLLKRGVLPFF
jgi:hypothetical protein